MAGLLLGGHIGCRSGLAREWVDVEVVPLGKTRLCVDVYRRSVAASGKNQEGRVVVVKADIAGRQSVEHFAGPAM